MAPPGGDSPARPVGGAAGVPANATLAVTHPHMSTVAMVIGLNRLLLMGSISGLPVRSHVLVGDFGERIAATYYGVELLPQFTPGHDLVDRRRRRIDVKTLHATPDKSRTIIGQPKRPCDLIFALRLHYDYTPAEALEIPIELAEAYVGANGKLSWTRKLASEPAVVHLDAAQLDRGDPHSAGAKRRSQSGPGQHP